MQTSDTALLLVDLQNDFCPGGALAVPDGDSVIPVANRLQPSFQLIVASQDWHPPDHKSFAAAHPGKHPGETIRLLGTTQVLWPVHCVEGTRGAAFVDGLYLDRIVRVFRKGTDPDIDSYSAFFDNGRIHSTGLNSFLKESGVTRLCVMGLATEYCVRSTVLDARDLGYEVLVVEDGCRGVDLSPGDSARAWRDMHQAGARVVQSSEVTE